MIYAVDSSVLMAIFKGQSTGSIWMNFLIETSPRATLVSCDVVWAELTPIFPSHRELMGRMEDLGITYNPIIRDTAFRAGETFGRYRRAGGPRDHLIPDFLIAAHAECQANGLIAKDRGYIRTYFKGLHVLAPEK